jgi:hypothetical protein
VKSQVAHILGGALAISLGSCVILFRSERRATDATPSSTTQWRFRLASVGCVLNLALAYPFGVSPALSSVLAFLFLTWPLLALWLSAAPLAYRRPSGYLLSAVSGLSIVFWYAYWSNMGL